MYVRVLECVSCPTVSLSRPLTHSDLFDLHSLLVGAPREWAEYNVPANRTGGLYSCSITANQSDCNRVKLVDPGEAFYGDGLSMMNSISQLEKNSRTDVFLFQI